MPRILTMTFIGLIVNYLLVVVRTLGDQLEEPIGSIPALILTDTRPNRQRTP